MMNWLDLLLLAVVVFFAFAGWQKGLVRQLFDVAGVIASYLVALRYGNEFILWLDSFLPLGLWFNQLLPQMTAQGINLADVIVRIIGFALLFGAVTFIFRFAGNIAHHIFSLPILGLLNGLAGMVLGGIKGILLGIIIVGLMTLVGTPFFVQALSDSSLAATLLSVLSVLYEQMISYILTDLV